MDKSAHETEKYVYDHIPSLKELLPSSSGLPGVEYAQVTTNNLRLAQDNGWSKLSGKQKIYTIRGPKGEAHCELYGKGKPIPGQGPRAGKRICWVDKTIRELTGLGLSGPLPEEPRAQDAPKPVKKVSTE